MHISTEWHNDQFNLNIHKKEGQDAFLSIKGCRIKDYNGKKFIAFPATKNQTSGNWWNHAWAADEFQQYVMGIALKSQPGAKANPNQAVEDIDNDLPF